MGVCKLKGEDKKVGPLIFLPTSVFLTRPFVAPAYRYRIIFLSRISDSGSRLDWQLLFLAATLQQSKGEGHANERTRTVGWRYETGESSG